MSNLILYSKYAWRSIQRGGQRSFFAILCIAVGVAAIVALQNTGYAIQDTIAGDARTNAGADVVVSTVQRFFTKDDLAKFDTLKQQGTILDYTTRVSSTGLSVRKPDGTDSNAFGSFYLAFIIDPAKYPYYGNITFATPDNSALKSVLTQPGQIVLNSKMAKGIGAKVGDKIKAASYGGRQGELQVVGILSDKTSSPGTNGQADFTGYGYISPETATPFFTADQSLPDTVLVKTASTQFADNKARDAIRAASPTYEAQTSEERNTQLKQGIDGLRTLLSYVGLISLLIGSVGVVNTMLVVVGRRSTEIATIKALGMEGGQTVRVFVIESAILGVIGSIFGVVLGELLSLLMARVAQGLVNRSLDYQIYGLPIVLGLIVGVVTAIVFGLLPAYSASKIPPAQVLRQKTNSLPRISWWATLLIILVMTVVMGALCGVILDGNYLLGFITAFGTLVSCSLLVLIFSGILWLVGKLPLPFGLNYKMARRNLSRGRGKSATTMLVMAVGIFSVALVLILASSLKATVQSAIEQSFGYNAQITAKDDAQWRQIQATLDSKEVPGYQKNITLAQANVRLISAGGVDTNELRKRETAKKDENTKNGKSNMQSSQAEDALADIVGLPSDAVSRFYRLNSGRINGSDTEAMIDKSVQDFFGLKIGDKMVYRDLAANQEFELTIVGVYESKNAIIGALGSVTTSLPKAQSIPSHITALEVTFDRDKLDQSISYLKAQYPGLDITDLSYITNVVNQLIDNITAFPVLLALLCLIAGAVLIANNVALAVLERRTEMGVMKSIGADSNRVLAIINWETGIVGFLGGLIGFGLASFASSALVQQLGTPDNPAVLAISPFITLGMILLAVGLALAATVSSAWGAVHEKPLVVLRYE